MIPKNIDRQAVLEAIKDIDEHGIPKRRLSRTYNLKYNGKLYPPKYLISIANRKINGQELEPFAFGGGTETNSFLERLGFEVVPFVEPLVSSVVEEANGLEVVTVTIGNFSGECPDNNDRLSFMEDIITEHLAADIILFPAGYFYFNFQRQYQIDYLCQKISAFLKVMECTSMVCVGVDCDNSRDQLAVAINKEGICAVGRKFYPTADEDGYIRTANTYNDREMGYPRIFKVKGKSVFLAVCYDGFGIRHCKLPNLGVGVVLVLAHQFWKQGEGPSGDVDFARKGFAGASQHWNCPVFGTAVFFCREIPESWPTGVFWTDKSKSVRHFKYQDNKMSWDDRKVVVGDFEKALCYKYVLDT